MEPYILSDIPFEINLNQLMKKLHVNEGTQDARNLKKLVDKAQKIGKPKAIYRIAYIESRGDDYVIMEGVKLSSRVLVVNLEHAYRAFPLLSTCGWELEELSCTVSDMLQIFWIDTIKEMALRTAMETLKRHLKETYKIVQSATMSPGSLKDWPIEEQKPLFTLVGDTENLIGVKLTDSYMMIPTKSVSALYFPTKENFESCQLCPRENCTGRRALYDSELYGKKYLKK